MKALITGASSGIGRELAKILSTQYEELILVARNEEQLKNLQKTLSCNVTIIIADLANTNERQKIIKFIQNHSPDLIINNAGSGLYGMVTDISTQDQMHILNLNVMALAEITIEAIKTMKKSKKQGTILNISSAAAFLPFPYFATYAASKAFVKHLSQSCYYETAPFGIKVLASCPGMVITDFGRRAAGGSRKAKHSIFSMPVQKAAKIIIKQIHQGKILKLFDWKYQVAIFFTKLLPKKLINKILKNILVKI